MQPLNAPLNNFEQTSKNEGMRTMNHFFFHSCGSYTMSIQNGGFCISAQLKQSRLSQRTALKIGARLFLQPRVAGLFSLLSHSSAGPTAQHLELWSFKPLPCNSFRLGQCRTPWCSRYIWECFFALSVKPIPQIW